VDKIFDPYFSTKNEGSGLGLAITQLMINNHGGYISVDSTFGVGATFALYLPASKILKEPKQESEIVSKASSTARILIMDDEEMVRNVAKKMLTRLGHEVELSEHGEEALKLYRNGTETSKRFDLVIMDLTIPGGMGGKDAVQEILKLDPEAKVIVSSGYSNDPIMAKFEDYGFCTAIVKPYRLQDLSRVINQRIA
jgi:CheY-like chemotaxis protein